MENKWTPPVSITQDRHHRSSLCNVFITHHFCLFLWETSGQSSYWKNTFVTQTGLYVASHKDATSDPRITSLSRQFRSRRCPIPNLTLSFRPFPPYLHLIQSNLLPPVSPRACSWLLNSTLLPLSSILFVSFLFLSFTLFYFCFVRVNASYTSLVTPVQLLRYSPSLFI